MGRPEEKFQVETSIFSPHFLLSVQPSIVTEATKQNVLKPLQMKEGPAPFMTSLKTSRTYAITFQFQLWLPATDI